MFLPMGQPELPVPALSDIHCASYCVYDKTTDMIVISQNMDDKIYPASQTKIMTCMLSLDYLDTDAKLTVSESAMASIGSDSSVMGIGVGERLKFLSSFTDLCCRQETMRQTSLQKAALMLFQSLSGRRNAGE